MRVVFEVYNDTHENNMQLIASMQKISTLYDMSFTY